MEDNFLPEGIRELTIPVGGRGDGPLGTPEGRVTDDSLAPVTNPKQMWEIPFNERPTIGDRPISSTDAAALKEITEETERRRKTDAFVKAQRLEQERAQRMEGPVTDRRMQEMTPVPDYGMPQFGNPNLAMNNAIDLARAITNQENRADLKKSVGDSNISHMIGDVWNAAKAPGDAYAGRLDPNSNEAIKRSFDLAGILTLGQAPKNALAPHDPNTIGIFGSTRANTADREALYKATKLSTKGQTPEQIWYQTGWDLTHPDGIPRFEIPDFTSKLKALPEKGSSAPLGQILDHPELYKAYPDLANVPVYLDPALAKSGTHAYYQPKVGGTLPYIAVNPSISPKQAHSGILHEVQHWVQQRERMAAGANPSMFNLPNNEHWKYQAMQRQLQQARDFQDLTKMGLNEEKARAAMRDMWGSDLAPGYMRFATEPPERLIKNLEDLKEILSRAEKHGYGGYNRSMGEVEARNVQYRFDNYMPEHLRITPPSHSQSVPHDRQIQTSWKDIGADSTPMANVGEKSLKSMSLEELSLLREQLNAARNAIENATKAKELELGRKFSFSETMDFQRSLGRREIDNKSLAANKAYWDKKDEIIKWEKNNMIGYRGTPHSIEEFKNPSLTGEGTATRGYGTYVTDNPESANWYRTEFARPTVGGKPLDLGNNLHSEAFARAVSIDPNERFPPIPNFPGVENYGNVFQVKMNVDPNHLLNWNKPIPKHNDYIRDVLRSLNLNADKGTVKQLINEISGTKPGRGAFSNQGSPEGSKLLDEKGIRGIVSRELNPETSDFKETNWTIFNNELVDVLKNMNQYKGGPMLSMGPEAVATAKQMLPRDVQPSGLYSHGAEAAKALPQKVGTPDQMKAMLVKAGTKPDEFKWAKWDKATAGKTKITKEEAEAILRDGLPKVEETMLVPKGLPAYADGGAVIDDTDQNTPEHPDTLFEQVSELAKGNRQAVMFPNGTVELPLFPGMKRTVTPRGIFHYNPEVLDDDAIHHFSAMNRENEILDMGPFNKEDVHSISQKTGETIHTLTERSPHGKEVKSVAGTPSTMGIQMQHLNRTKGEGNTLHVETPEETVSRRA